MSLLERMGAHAKRGVRQLGRPVSIGGRDYRVRGYIANALETESGHEPYMNEMYGRALTRRPGAFIDVGANLGQTLMKLLAFDPDRPYFGFEPQISCCHFISQFIADNALKHARILPIALSDSDGVHNLVSWTAHDVTASLLNDASMPEPNFTTIVPTRSGDALFAELKIREISVLKIDVEGAELLVLGGLQKTIDELRPWVFFEVLPNFEGEARTRLAESQCAQNTKTAAGIEAFFRDRGYHIHLIANDGALLSVTGFELDDPTAFRGWNYVATPPEDSVEKAT